MYHYNMWNPAVNRVERTMKIKRNEMSCFGTNTSPWPYNALADVTFNGTAFIRKLLRLIARVNMPTHTRTYTPH